MSRSRTRGSDELKNGTFCYQEKCFFFFTSYWQNGIPLPVDSCAASLKACDSDDFPNLYILFKIAATLPVTSCRCERSISTMRILNNYMRCTMGESRLSSLAIMHIKYEQSAPRELGGLSFRSEIPCSTRPVL